MDAVLTDMAQPVLRYLERYTGDPAQARDLAHRFNKTCIQFTSNSV